MQASDIMSAPVISVAPDTPVSQIAALLFEKRISGVPVLADGRLVGMVSEGDLLYRREIGAERPKRAGSWWLRLLGTDPTPAEYVKDHGRVARDVMTREVQTVAPHTPVAEIATLLESRGIKRVPVVRDGRVVGIVSRANLVQALAGSRPPAAHVTPPTDQAIRGRLLAELARQPWWRGSGNVIVSDGVVHYFGTFNGDAERDAARVAAENIPGVRRVEDHRMAISRIAEWE